MTLIKDQLQQIIQKHLTRISPNLQELAFEVDYPAAEKFGDYTSNAALKAAKILQKPPLAVADLLILKLKADKKLGGIFEKIEAASPGFINFYLSPAYLTLQAKEILALRGLYGQLKIGKSEKMQLEFISANPTGPLTIGNGRGGFFGDVLGNAFKRCGYKVVKEYLVNDAGKQIESLGHSVLHDEQAVYRGEYIDKLHESLKGEADAYYVGQKAAKVILDKIIKRTVEEKMKIKFDVWFFEDEKLRKTKKIDAIFEWLKKNNYVYEQDGAWWFKSTAYGDTRDRVIKKSDGEFTYLAQDFAYLKNKFQERKFTKVVNVWGADHHGDVLSLLAAAEALGYKGKQEIILMQFVRLFQGGKEIRMSKRKGVYITMDELIDLVGHDAARFLFLMYSNNSHINFDLNLAKERSEKNPVYYVQYAYARISGILRQKEAGNVKADSKAILNYDQQTELALLKTLLKLPEILEQIASDYEVQKLPNYAMEIADKFHEFYNSCRVIDNGKVNASRLALVRLTKKILREVLAIIGISALEKM